MGGTGGRGGGGAGGTIKLFASVLESSGIGVDTAGGQGGVLIGDGGNGRFILGNNTTAPFAGTANNTTQESFAGFRAVNPFIQSNGGGIATPLIPDLTGGAEAFGVLDEATVSSLNAAFTTIRDQAPADAEAAIFRMDTGPSIYDVDFEGFDMLVMFAPNLNSLLDPQLGIDLDGTDAHFLVDLQTQGFMEQPDFGGAGPLVLDSLTGLQVYATLVPEGGTIFNAAVEGAEVRAATLANGDWAYLLPPAVGPSADFDADSDVDGNDFLRWQTGFGITSDATRGDGDADDDGDVDDQDLLIWQGNYGAPGDAGTLSSQVVPEPTTCSILILAAVTGAMLRCRRRA
jgi:hypothetical protein